jgi:hypothetical protein
MSDFLEDDDWMTAGAADFRSGAFVRGVSARTFVSGESAAALRRCTDSPAKRSAASRVRKYPAEYTVNTAADPSATRLFFSQVFDGFVFSAGSVIVLN